MTEDGPYPLNQKDLGRLPTQLTRLRLAFTVKVSKSALGHERR